MQMRNVTIGHIAALLSCLVLWPMLASATVFWDDELESGNTGYDFTGLTGVFTFDTSVKMSGAGSIRLDYPSMCQPYTYGGTGCGGFTDRSFPTTDTFYRRVYFMMSAGFQTSIDTFTKMFRSDTTGANSNWWAMGQGNGIVGGKTFVDGAQNVPAIGQSVNYFSSFTFSDARWYCIETYEKLNTPGVANGIAQAWVDGVQVMNVTNVMYRQAGDNSMFVNNRLYRQTGIGSIWYDRLAVGNTRIGCAGTGTPPPTVPSTPTNLQVH